MVLPAKQPQSKQEREDALTYLPRKRLLEYARNAEIYNPSMPSAGLYLVIQGRVKICSPLEDGGQAVIAIVGADHFFGEYSLVGAPARERATAMEPTAAMLWTAAEIEEHVHKDPKLGIALTQVFVERCVALTQRVQSLALDKTPRRVALALLGLAQDMGEPQPDGALRLPPVSHEMISQYIGTSREIVTSNMANLRRQGFVDYSRRCMMIYADALRSFVNDGAALTK